MQARQLVLHASRADCKQGFFEASLSWVCTALEMIDQKLESIASRAPWLAW